jgi:hypothetical protein
VLATSREGLAVEGERVVPVPPLGTPERGADFDTVAGSEAVRLFVERAGSVDGGFALTPDNAAAVTRLCQRLDGVPLAIELAAAQTLSLTPAEIAAGLDRRFDLLAVGRRRAVGRHQTLRAAIDWSYQLLSESERRLLARLAIFAGGCTRDSVEDVCGFDPIERREVMALLARLVAKSLVEADHGGEFTRYRLLETIREYGDERLGEYAEIAVVHDRHGRHYADLLDTVVEEVSGPSQIEAIRRLVAERDNLQAAMTYALEAGDADIALHLLTYGPSRAAGMWRDGFLPRFPADPVLRLTGAVQHRLYPLGLAVAADMAALRGSFRESAELRRAALEAARHLEPPDPYVELMLTYARSAAATSAGAWIDDGLLYEEQARILQSIGLVNEEGNAWAGAASSYVLAGAFERALPLAERGLELARRYQGPRHVAWALAALAGAVSRDNPQRAKRLLQESAQARAKLDPIAPEVFGPYLHVQAFLVAARLADWDEILRMATRCIRGLHWLGDRLPLAGVLNVTARALVATDPETSALLQGGAGQVATVAVLNRPSLQLERTTEQQKTEAQTTPPPGLITELRRETTAVLHQALGEARLRELRAQGRTIDIDDLVSTALQAVSRSRATSPAMSRD